MSRPLSPERRHLYVQALKQVDIFLDSPVTNPKALIEAVVTRQRLMDILETYVIREHASS